MKTQRIENKLTRRRLPPGHAALGRGLRDLLLHGELSAAAERAQALRRPKPIALPQGIPPFARPWAEKVWRKSGKPL